MKFIEMPPDAPERPEDGHKGTFGSVLIVAGSRGMSGAASLSARSALHGGAGLVTLAVPQCIQNLVAAAHPSYMTLGLADLDGKFSTAAADVLLEITERQTVVAMGPGLGQSSDLSQLVQDYYHQCELPLVLDADGLNAFVDQPERLSRQQDSPLRVLTPHPGEFARLLGQSTKEVQADREDLAFEFAKQHGVVLVLKGSGTIICDGRRYAVNSSGSTALATGGTGDILTGLIASLIAQGMTGFDAAHLAVHLHGLAGEIAGTLYSDRFVTSLEILNALSPAWLQYEKTTRSSRIGFQ